MIKQQTKHKTEHIQQANSDQGSYTTCMASIKLNNTQSTKNHPKFHLIIMKLNLAHAFRLGEEEERNACKIKPSIHGISTSYKPYIPLEA